MTDKEAARELYNALDRVLELLKSGKVRLPSLKKVLGGRSMSSLPLDESGSSLRPDLWKPLSPEQWGRHGNLDGDSTGGSHAGLITRNLQES